MQSPALSKHHYPVKPSFSVPLAVPGQGGGYLIIFSERGVEGYGEVEKRGSLHKVFVGEVYKLVTILFPPKPSGKSQGAPTGHSPSRSPESKNVVVLKKQLVRPFRRQRCVP